MYKIDKFNFFKNNLFFQYRISDQKIIMFGLRSHLARGAEGVLVQAVHTNGNGIQRPHTLTALRPSNPCPCPPFLVFPEKFMNNV